jgi:predicted SnoaL-like aldol condensation-catalyzing enzyme
MTTKAASEANRNLVVKFYELAINQRRAAESAAQYIGLPYIQHNPDVPQDGPAGFLEFIGHMFKQHPDMKVIVHRAIADETFVALHVHLKRDENDPGLAIAEFFRVENGKIIEHWDVTQSVPVKTASGNAMF